MEELSFSFVIPVYNRPDEIQELLQSMLQMQGAPAFEVVIVEDGSQQTSEDVIKQFRERLQISYYQKENSGPGDSRNYGMRLAKGNYFIVLDSDCLLPKPYLAVVQKELKHQFVHCFGGADAAHASFTDLQKAINYTMTSFWTTGGIRGKKNTVGKFQPRSFNMGISKEAFEKTQGFGNIHPGEDPDLSFRIWKAGYETRFFPNAFVYHKRRIDWGKFYQQVRKFGLVRPILNKWHPGTAKITYWFPTVFLLSGLVALVLLAWGWWQPIALLGLYFLLLFVDSFLVNKRFKIAVFTIFAVLIQFYGYGTGFLKSTILVNFSNKEPESLFPKLFFKKG